ncbi:MAG: glycoside hydrolase family 5 protein [Bacteroidota bacterium]
MKTTFAHPSPLRLLSIGIFSLLLLFACKPIEPIPDPDPDPEEEPTPDPNLTAGIGEARDISSFDLVAEMGVGWNLGNSFDVTSRDKTFWGNPLPTKSVITAVKNRGFGTIRIPVTWGFHQSEVEPYTIEATYLNRVKQVVDYAFQNQMHVILNVHHDDDWVKPNAVEAEKTKTRLSSLWTQVATFFEAYNDSLIFETLNEPRLKGVPEEWSGGTPEGRAFINEFHQVSVDAIRATGGNNEKRHLMIPTWAASTVPAAMDDLVIPNDDPKVIISLHSYFPWAFAGEASVSWGSDQDKVDMEAEFDKIRQKWVVEESRPVILGEWGSIEDNPREIRSAYASFYAREAAERGLLTVVWDDGGMFGLLDRATLEWPYGDIANAIVEAAK